MAEIVPNCLPFYGAADEIWELEICYEDQDQSVLREKEEGEVCDEREDEESIGLIGQALKWGADLRMRQFPHPSCSPPCSCDSITVKRNFGPDYTQLGTGHSAHEIVSSFAARFSLNPAFEIRVEFAEYSYDRSGETWQGCPAARDTIKRGPGEKLLLLLKKRSGHGDSVPCPHAVMVMAVLIWDGLDQDEARRVYREVAGTLGKFGTPLKRRCFQNRHRTCKCNSGGDGSTGGQSVSLGCSASCFTLGCKFAVNPMSSQVRKFKLKERSLESGLEQTLNSVSDKMGDLLSVAAPAAFARMTALSQISASCRLGTADPRKRPFSGIAAVSDFASHTHVDRHNVRGGCTVILSLVRADSDPSDQQLHVLPRYTLSRAAKSKSRILDASCRAGIGFQLTNGSVLIEVALLEQHSTTALKHPCKFLPTRLGLVFYQHETVIGPNHGRVVTREWKERKFLKQFRQWKEEGILPQSGALAYWKHLGMKYPKDLTSTTASVREKNATGKVKVKSSSKPFAWIRGQSLYN